MDEFNPSIEEAKTISVDFDGVIHTCDKGYCGGVIYGDPIEGSLDSIKMLSEKYDVVVHSARARHDKPLVNGKTGKELIWEWLDAHGFSSYIKEVTEIKPRAFIYIDDKAIRFENWKMCLDILNLN